MAKILQFSVDKVSLMVCVSWWISSEEESEEILLENVLWKEKRMQKRPSATELNPDKWRNFRNKTLTEIDFNEKFEDLLHIMYSACRHFMVI